MKIENTCFSCCLCCCSGSSSSRFFRFGIIFFNWHLKMSVKINLYSVRYLERERRRKKIGEANGIGIIKWESSGTRCQKGAMAITAKGGQHQVQVQRQLSVVCYKFVNDMTFLSVRFEFASELLTEQQQLLQQAQEGADWMRRLSISLSFTTFQWESRKNLRNDYAGNWLRHSST